MKFREQLILTLLDKGATGLLLLVAGYYLNRLLETVRSRRALENEFAKLRDAKRMEFLEKQLSQFYWPIYMRLEIDNAVWHKILDIRNERDELRRIVGASVEQTLILPNHEEIVRIMQSNIHLAEPNDETLQLMLRYIRHVVVYKAIRGSQRIDVDPAGLEEPWPGDLFPQIRGTTEKLQAQYASLSKTQQ